MTHHHIPTLETIRMVEKTIKKYSGKYTKYPLWKKLPKKTMYQTFSNIIDYLLQSNKIYIKDKLIYSIDQNEVKKFLNKRYGL